MKILFDPFVIPFTAGVIFLFAVVIVRYVSWYMALPEADKSLVKRGVLTVKSLKAAWEVVRESLLHVKIFKVNPLLGYMHMSLALGWFLMIVVGKLETSTYLHDYINPPYVHVFFRFFFPLEPESYIRHFNYASLMDALLIVVLSGVLIAWGKRLWSQMVGMRKTTHHTLGDRAAMSSLWLVFPMRFLAESFTCGAVGSGPFFTGTAGVWFASFLPVDLLMLPAWWMYSTVLGVFLFALPYSRYMHIITEIPLIFLRNYGLKASPKETSYTDFQLQSCSRCGICIDPCQVADKIQSVYFLRDKRYDNMTDALKYNCLMCGRCEQKCPVGIELNTIRLGERVFEDKPDYSYLGGVDRSSGEGQVGYFAGCMTLLSPKIMAAMDKIFAAADEDVWWADRDGGSCCGRPMKLSGNLAAAEQMVEYNKSLIEQHGVDTLVVSCPICLKTFKEDYALKGVRVLHHSEYFEELIASGRLKLTKNNRKLAYHDPCELGRGLGITDEPRGVISAVGELVVSGDGSEEKCCGGSLANFRLTDASRYEIIADVVEGLAGSGAEAIVTACPQCKKSLGRNRKIEVVDLAEVVAEAI